MDAVLHDVASSPLSDREKALFAYLAVVNREPANAREGDVLRLTAIGWSDAEIYDAVTVCALFNFFNRWIDGMGVPDTPPRWYDERLAKTGDFGYAP